jgi:DNA-binding LacI/PurR family transcriptional regulator
MVSKNPTIREVAKMAGVSIQTVSNTLNNPAVVKDSTRDRVEKGHRGTPLPGGRLRPSPAHRQELQRRRVHRPAGGQLFRRHLRSLPPRSLSRGDHRRQRILLFAASGLDEEIEQYRSLLRSTEVDSLVVTSTVVDDPRTAWLKANGANYVTFGRPWGKQLEDPSSLWVDIDGRSGMRKATEHSLSSYGAKVAFIGWPEGSGTGDERHLGWQETMRFHGHSSQLADLEMRVEDGVAEGETAMRAIAEKVPDCDAVVCASDALALGALFANHGAIPVVGYDNTPAAQTLGISSVDQPLDDVAARIFALLAGEPGIERLVQPELVVRESSHQPRSL